MDFGKHVQTITLNSDNLLLLWMAKATGNERCGHMISLRALAFFPQEKVVQRNPAPRKKM